MSQFREENIIVSESALADATIVTIINQDELITVFQFRFVWDGGSTPWTNLDPPLPSNCSGNLDECVAQGKFRTVGSISKEFTNRKIQITYRKSGGPLKAASADIHDLVREHAYIARGSLG